MRCMFCGCSSLKKLNLSCFKTDNIKWFGFTHPDSICRHYSFLKTALSRCSSHSVHARHSFQVYNSVAFSYSELCTHHHTWSQNIFHYPLKTLCTP